MVGILLLQLCRLVAHVRVSAPSLDAHTDTDTDTCTGPSASKGAKQAAALQSAMIAMWRGDVSQALATVVEADALTADFVSIAASAGHQAWLAASRLFAHKLELKGRASACHEPGFAMSRQLFADLTPVQDTCDLLLQALAALHKGNAA